ncbi:MAG: polyprenyl synthetase family protein [Planctomycetaceae bacterium]|nr:polyprenyl synthetase family protein [Planctomycetaceae bacterium]
MTDRLQNNPRTLRPARDAGPGIPPTARQRQDVRAACRDYAARCALTPPLPLDALVRHGRAALTEAGLAHQFEEFAAVILSNELWRPTVAAVPMNRRMLLLPQCLRLAPSCKADVDPLGLTCRRCGGCAIGDFETEAQRLGYVTLVAEGSPVVMSLIQSGQVQAVIGVSCLATLRSVYPYMEAAAVPGIALPLLQDGCVDTSLDEDWLWEALYASSDAGGCIDLQALRTQVESWFTPEAIDDIFGDVAGPADELARAWLARAGKRWRPLLTVCAAAALSGQSGEATGELHTLAMAVECFHKASLIHDDIEDADASRYGEQTLHQSHGVPIALNVGDLLLGQGYRLIAQCGAAPERMAAMLLAASNGHRDLCLGQGRELAWTNMAAEKQPPWHPRSTGVPPVLPVSDILEIHRMKTAPAFQVALELGAIYGGAGEDVLKALASYSQALGAAYQIHDDLADESDGGLSILPSLAAERPDQDPRAAAEALLSGFKRRAIDALGGLTNVALKGLCRRVLAAIFNDLGRMGCCDDHSR